MVGSYDKEGIGHFKDNTIEKKKTPEEVWINGIRFQLNNSCFNRAIIDL